MRQFALHLTESQRAALERVHARWAKTHPNRSIEFMLYSEVFRLRASEYRHMVSRFETEGGETRKIPSNWADPASGVRSVRLRPEEVDWGSQRASTDLGQEVGGVTLRFPDSILDRLERGLALRQAWSQVYGSGAPVSLYDSFEAWAVEQAMAWVQRELNAIEDLEIAAEEDTLYPGIDDQPGGWDASASTEDEGGSDPRALGTVSSERGNDEGLPPTRGRRSAGEPLDPRFPFAGYAAGTHGSRRRLRRSR